MTNSDATYSPPAQTIDPQDVVPVHGRIAWGPVVAGSILTLSLYFLLTLHGGAIGLSVSDDFRGRDIGIAAAVYAIAVTAVCLFAGGFVASQLTTGENQREAGMYGLTVWAVVSAMLLYLMAIGVKAGSAAASATPPVSQGDAEEAGEVATSVTWYTFLGTLISMAAAVAAVAGLGVRAGPAFRLFAPRRPARRP